MIKELLYKWFDLQPLACPTCEVLKQELANERLFNKVLFDKLIKPEIFEPVIQQVPQIPINRAMSFRQAVKEREEQDRIAARKLQDINKLEEELQVNQDAKESTGS